MQKVGNFRDQLNKNMFENATKEENSPDEHHTKETEEKPKNLEPHKKYKIPPRINNKDLDVEIKDENLLKTEEKLENKISLDKPQDAFGNTTNIKSEQPHSRNKPTANEKSLSFSEEHNVSVDCSEIKNFKNKERNNSLLDSSSLSIENKRGVTTNLETKIDSLNYSTQNTNDFNTILNDNHNTAPFKKSSELPNKRRVTNNVSDNKRSNQDNSLYVTSEQNIAESIMQSKPVVSAGIDNNNILPIITNEFNSSLIIQENLNVNVENFIRHDDDIQQKTISTTEIENFSELLRKLELLKNEIRELKNSKISIQTNYEVEANKNKLYQNEIEQLRKNINSLKVKEIKEGEAMLRLEIKNLSDNIEYHKKTNDLLQKENESLKIEVKKLQDYLTEMMEMKNSKAFNQRDVIDDFYNENQRKINNQHTHEEYNVEYENEIELNNPIIQNEDIQPEEEENAEIFDQDAKNYVLPLEPFKEEPKEILEEQEEDIKESENLGVIQGKNIITIPENSQLIVSEGNFEADVCNLQPSINEPEHLEVQNSNDENNEEINISKSSQILNYSFENRHEEKVEEKSYVSNLQKNAFFDYEEPSHKETSLWDIIEDQKKVPTNEEKISLNPFEEKNSNNIFVENVFSQISNNPTQKEKKLIPEKKESIISSNVIKPKNLVTEDKKESKTPQSKIEKNLFELTSDLSDDVFSSISQDNIKPAPFKKIENINLNRKNNAPVLRQQLGPKPQDPFTNMSKDKYNNTKLLNLQFNADEDIGSIFGTLTRNENKGNSLFD